MNKHHKVVNEDAGPSGLGALFGRSEGDGGSDTGDSSRWGGDSARRHCQAEELQLGWTDPQYVETHTKSIFQRTSRAGLRQFRDHHWNAFGEENSDLLGSVL